MANIFYRGIYYLLPADASVVILTYDITRKDSFEKLKNYWHLQVQQFAPKKVGKFLNIILSVYAVAANKSDIFQYEAVPESNARNYAKVTNTYY